VKTALPVVDVVGALASLGQLFYYVMIFLRARGHR